MKLDLGQSMAPTRRGIWLGLLSFVLGVFVFWWMMPLLAAYMLYDRKTGLIAIFTNCLLSILFGLIFRAFLNAELKVQIIGIINVLLWSGLNEVICYKLSLNKFINKNKLWCPETIVCRDYILFFIFYVLIIAMCYVSLYDIHSIVNMLANKTGILSIIENETQLKKNILASLIVWISIAGLFSLFVLKCSFNWFKNIVERQKLSGNIRPDFSFKNVHIPFEINLISLISLAILLLRDYSWNTNIVIASVFGAAFVAPLLNGLAFFHRRLKKTLSFVLFYTCFTILSPISMIICTIIGFVESVVKFSKDK